MAGVAELQHTTLCLGVQQGEQWQPVGLGFLLTDDQVVWLVTTSRVLERAGGAPISTWVKRTGDGVLLGLSAIMQSSGLDWVREPQTGLAMTVFPLHPEWDVRALPLAQTAPRGALQPLMGVHALGFPFGIHGFDPSSALPLVFSGAVVGLDAGRERIYTDVAPLPLCDGAPLLAGSGADGKLQLVLAGVMQGSLPTKAPVAPGSMPVGLASLSHATPIHNVIALFNGEAAAAQRDAARKAAESAQA